MVPTRARGRADELAAGFPEPGLRIEPAREEAFVHVGPGTRISPTRWQLVTEALRAWGAGRDRQPSDPGVRVTFLATPPRTPQTVPDCDFAVPLR
jgi:hypothetical protein